MDVLTDILTTLHLRSNLACRSELAAPWSVGIAPSRVAVFHMIDRGACWLRLDGEHAPIALAPRDLVVVPHGCGHQLSDMPVAPVRSWLDVSNPAAQTAGARQNGGDPAAVILCGTFAIEFGAAHPLMTVLPRLIHIRGARELATTQLHATLTLLASEAALPRPGGEIVVQRLVDVLFIQVVRAWLEQEPPQHRGWLGALHDASIGAALSALHAEPRRPWTNAALASVAGMSRSAFCARFTTLVGEPPLRYLTRWRIALAANMLRSRDLTVAALAEACGYASEGAFSRAFKHQMGIAPAAYRRQFRSMN